MKNTVYFAFIFGLTVFGLTACDVPSEQKKEKAAAATATPSPPAGAGLIATALAEPAPNRYRVNLRWTRANPANFPLIISRESRRNGLKHLNTLAPDAITYEDQDVTAGETYTYFLSRKLTEGPELLAKKDLIVPQDMVLEGMRALPPAKDIARLFLMKNADIFWSHEQKELVVEEIHADDSVLRSLPYGDRATVGARGSDGPTIILKAKRGTGRLRIFASGQFGGEGVKGTTGEIGKAGKAGNAGVLGWKEPWSLAFFAELREKVVAQRKQEWPATDARWNEYYQCATAPTDGTAGGPGGEGGRGGKGARGGDASYVYVQIENPSGFDVDVIELPGAGGTRGEAGDGGMGGAGGLAGARDEHHICPAAKDGMVGARGKAGEVGEPGVAGETTAHCLELGDAQLGQCEEVKKRLGIGTGPKSH